jgi:hypothetical protein
MSSCRFSIAIAALSSCLFTCGGEAVTYSDATSFPYPVNSTDEASLGLAVGACQSTKLAASVWHVGPEVTDFWLTALDDARVDDPTIATVSPTPAVWKTSEMNLDPQGNVGGDDYVAHVLLLCGVRAGTTHLRVHRHDSSDDAGSILLLVGQP